MSDSVEDTVEDTVECSICNVEYEYKYLIPISCRAMHSFCFSCILKSIENKHFKKCPLCKGNSEYIILNPSIKTQEKFEYNDSTFNTIEFFKEALPILNSILKLEDTCVIKRSLLQVYLNNKQQLIHALKYYKTDKEIINIINWKLDSNIFNQVFTNFTDPTGSANASSAASARNFMGAYGISNDDTRSLIDLFSFYISPRTSSSAAPNSTDNA